MRNLVRFLITSLSAAVIAYTATLAGCTPPVPADDAGPPPACLDTPVGCCKKPADCGVNRFDWVCVDPNGAKICTGLCRSNSDCVAPSRCEDGVCQPDACGEDSECGGGQTCQNGACKAAIASTAVTSCLVLPARQLVKTGAEKPFTVIAKNAEGAVVGYKGEVAWSAGAGDNASVTGTGVTGTVTGGTAAGTATITATIGSASCTASAVNFAAVPATDTRVVVADLLTNAPLAGAIVRVNDSEETTDADGVASFAGVAGAQKTISVFGDDDHAYVTMVGVDTNDVVAYLKPKATAGSFTGTMSSGKFEGLSDIQGTVHLALFGGSIPGNLIDLQLSNLIGEIPENEEDKTIIKFGGEEFKAPLPGGIVIGIGDTMFKQDYVIPATPGIRGIWGLGGNAKIESLTKALQPVINGGTENLEVGPILTGILPLLGRLQAGLAAAQEVEGGVAKPLEFKLNTALRLRAEVKIPDLAAYTIDGDPYQFEGAIVLGGALYSPQGLVPLGLTAGIDAAGGPDDAQGKPTGDGKVDADGAGTAAGSVALRMAPRHNGLEPSRYAVLALAASFSGLVTREAAAGEEPVESPPLVLSGLVALPDSLPFNDATPTAVTFRSEGFLKVPDATAIDGRTFSLGGSVAGAAFHRLDIGDETVGEWFVFFPPGTDVTGFEIPGVPETKRDRLTYKEEPTDELPGARLQTVALNETGGALDYDDILAFDSFDTNDLTLRVNAFSVRQILRPEPVVTP